MLSQVVRPMVRTQLQLLANSQTTRSTLVSTIANWLGFLGVTARVTHLKTGSGQIHLSLTVGKPEACDTADWQQILQKLGDGVTPSDNSQASMLTTQQTRQLQRLMAHIVQSSSSDADKDWPMLQTGLRGLGFDDETIAGIRSAAKVPQPLELLLENLDPDVAAIALPKAVSIALLDRTVNVEEDRALNALLAAMKQP